MFCIVLFFYLPNIVDIMTYSQIVALTALYCSMFGYRVGMTDPKPRCLCLLVLSFGIVNFMCRQQGVRYLWDKRGDIGTQGHYVINQPRN